MRIEARLKTLEKHQEARRQQDSPDYPLIWHDIQRLTPDEVTRRLKRANALLTEQGREAIPLCG